MANSKEDVFAEVLREVADSSVALSLPELAHRHGLDAAVVEALLTGFTPFGLLEVDDSGLIHHPPELGRPMLRSLAFCIEERRVLIDDWTRRGATCTDGQQILDRGVCLLQAVESKRVELGSVRPSQHTTVAKAVIKRGAAGKDSSLLMMLNPHSNRFQLIGGKARKQETPEKALEREISEEITTRTLRPGRDYTAFRLGGPVVSSFVSPTTGAYTTYTTQYFGIQLTEDIQLSASQRWIALPEAIAGRTHDGHFVMPSPADEPEFAGKVKMAPTSFTTNSSLPVTNLTESAVGAEAGSRRGGPWWVPVVTATVLLAVCVAAAVLLSNFVANTIVVGGFGLLLFLMLIFVALSWGLINSQQFEGLARLWLGRTSNGTSAGTKRPRKARGGAT